MAKQVVIDEQVLNNLIATLNDLKASVDADVEEADEEIGSALTQASKEFTKETAKDLGKTTLVDTIYELYKEFLVEKLRWILEIIFFSQISKLNLSALVANPVIVYTALAVIVYVAFLEVNNLLSRKHS